MVGVAERKRREIAEQIMALHVGGQSRGAEKGFNLVEPRISGTVGSVIGRFAAKGAAECHYPRIALIAKHHRVAEPHHQMARAGVSSR